MTTRFVPRIADEAILGFIGAHWDRHGFGPSVREVCQGVGFASTSAAWYRLRTLRDAGRVTWADGISRSLRLV